MKSSFAMDPLASTGCDRDFVQRLLHPPLTPLRENGLQVTFKQGAGVLEVLFGVGLGGGDAVEGFVEDGDDAVLFGSGGTKIGIP